MTAPTADDTAFATWLCMVDHAMHDRVGFGLHDLPPVHDWRALHDADIAPEAIATFIDLTTGLNADQQPPEGNQS